MNVVVPANFLPPQVVLCKFPIRQTSDSLCCFLLLFFSDYTYAGSARQMYHERNDLMHDMAVVRQIGALLTTLKVGTTNNCIQP